MLLLFVFLFESSRDLLLVDDSRFRGMMIMVQVKDSSTCLERRDCWEGSNTIVLLCLNRSFLLRGWGWMEYNFDYAVTRTPVRSVVFAPRASCTNLQDLDTQRVSNNSLLGNC